MFILKATEFIFKIYECNLKAYEYILNHTNVFWTYDNISIYHRIVDCNTYYIRQLWRSIVRCSFTVRCLFGTWSLLPPDSKLSCTNLRCVRWPSAFAFFFTNRLSNVDSNHDSLNALTFLLFLSYMLKNGPTYFKNLEVWTHEDF